MLAIRSHPTAWLIGALSVLFVVLGTGAVFAGISTGSGPASAAVVATPSPTPTETARPLPASQVGPSRIRTCSVAGLAADPRLMTLNGAVRRADDGTLLYSHNGATPSRTGSVLKVLTASAALAVLGPDFRITTQVLAGAAPGSIVLVGRGDASLSALAPGSESVYRGAPKLADLAAQTIAALDPATPITSLVLDASYWNPADKWDPSWKRTEQTIGYHSEVTALMVDGDRANPSQLTSPRSTDPISRAGQAFLSALRNADTKGVIAGDVAITTGTATGGAALAAVQSQPVSSLIPQMLLNSDNTMAEMLARIVSKESGFNGSAASLDQAIPSALFPDDPTTASTLTIIDGSGLSEFNAVPAEVMARFMSGVQAGAQLGAGNLAVVRDALPVAGKSGTLSSRFTGGNAVVRGNLTAKTGWIDTAYSLSGFVTAADGTVLTFAFFAVGNGIRPNAKDAIDSLSAGIFTCGDNLASS